MPSQMLSNLNSFKSKENIKSIPENTGVDATEAAIARIIQLLKHPDDLSNGKLASQRRKFAAEKASIDAQLKAAMETQLDDTKRGLDALAAIKQETNRVCKNLADIDQLCVTSHIQNYNRIRVVCEFS